jgi:hypothetical protein
MRRIAALIFAAIGMAACQPSAAGPLPAGVVNAAPPPSARYKIEAANFLRRLYANYDGKHQDVDLIGDHASQWFDPELAALIEAERSSGEAGTLDSDPICDCQDYGHLSVRITVLTADGKGARASVVATETDTGFDADGRKPRAFTYDLVRMNGQWRIHDISEPQMPSLRQALQSDIRGAASSR